MDVSELKLCPGRVYQWHSRGESRIISEGGGGGGVVRFDKVTVFILCIRTHKTLQTM